VYVKINTPPKFEWGKTHKGNKLKSQRPRKEGLFTLTWQFNWRKFLEKVTEAIEEEQENLLIDEMAWAFSGRKN
jgi:hypothetical protein